MVQTQIKTRVRAALACRIVNLDRVKFNDAVASGTYPCAPMTMKGSARIFTEEQLLPLFFFARLTEFGIPTGRAGQLACEMASAASSDYAEPADRITFVQGMMSNFFTPSKIKVQSSSEIKVNYDPEHETHDKHYGAGRIIFSIDFYIKHVREIIAERIEYERSILGEDDEEPG